MSQRSLHLKVFRILVLLSCFAHLSILASGPLSAVLPSRLASPAETGWWSAPFSWPSGSAGTTLLETGKILVAFSNGESAIWDPDSGSFARRPSPPTSGSGSRTPLPTDILDVLTQPWSRVEAQPAVGANAAMYQPGHILRSGGLAQTEPGSAVRTASVIDMTGPSPRWRETGSMAFARAFHNLTVLPDGRVLAVGGAAGSPDAGVPVTAAEMWDPSTGAWTTLAAMNTPRVPPAASLLLPDGRVLVTGADSTGRTSAELFSPPYLFKGPRPGIADAPAVLQNQADALVRAISNDDVAAVSLIGAGAVSQTFDQGQRFIALPFRHVQEGVEITVPDSRTAPPGIYQLFLLNRDGVPSDGTLVTVIASAATVPPVATAFVAEPPVSAAVASGLAIDATTWADVNWSQGFITTPSFSTTSGNQLLLAFISADRVSETITTVTGGGLTWQLVARTNVQRGTAEIWRAFATALLTNVTVTANLSQAAASSLTVVSFTGADPSGPSGAGAIGAIGSGNATSGAPTATLMTTRANSWVFGVGTDWNSASQRFPGPNQTLIHQYLHPSGNTWSQRMTAPTPVAGTNVTINDTSPTFDPYNLTICEVLPALGGGDTTAPTVAVSAPAADATVSGTTVTISADASDDVGVAGVQFTLDNVNIGTEDTSSPYSITWNTTTATNGLHSLRGVARDAAGNTTTSAAVSVTVNNTDTTAPTVSMSAPAANATVSGSTVTVSATASDNVSVFGVQFRLDNVNLGVEDTTAPYSITWNTTTATDGPHTLAAVARDAAGNTTTSADRFVTVSNADTTAPTVSMSAPAANATVSGTTVTVSATASDNVGVVGVQFTVDNINAGTEDTTSPYGITWNSTTVTDGPHTLRAVARDAAGNTTTSAGRSITVNNADTTPPTVSMSAPAANATVSGTTVTVSATASDNLSVAGVKFTLDNVDVGVEDTTSPYGITWNSTTTSNGSHTLRAVARDGAGNTTTSAGVAVTVNNGDTTAPTVSLSAPAANATVSGTIPVSATASDNVGVVGVRFRVDGVNFGSEDVSIPYSRNWNSTTATNGLHTLTAVARDAAGNSTTSAPVSVTVSNTDTTAPTVSMSAPSPNATVSGNAVTVSATASDNVGVVGVQFRLDGVSLGSEDTTSPYSIAWNTTTVSNGPHTLSAVARDAAGNTTTSSNRSVTVSNADTIPPTVGLTAPAANATVSGSGVTVSANASDNVAVAGVQFKLDNVNLGSEDTSSPYSITWNSTTTPNGAHTLTAVARDAAGNTTTSTGQSVTVSNVDGTAPTVSVSAPAANATVSGNSVNVAANASDNVAVVGVQFRLDNVNLGSEDTSSPYSITWNTTTTSDGSHTLTAVARDAAGNSTTSAGVTVTVDNTSPPPAATPKVIGTQIGGTFGDATGHSAQSHLVYAANSGVWWLLTLTSASDSLSNHVVKSFRSSGPDLTTATWSQGADSPSASGGGTMGSGRALGVAYVNNNPVDVIHADLSFADEGQEGTTSHIRATVSGTSITWGAWNSYVEGAATWTQPRGNTIGVSTGKVIHTGGAILQQEVDANVRKSNNADTGSTWSSGFSGVSVIDNSMINQSNAMAFAALANNVMLSVYDNGGGTSTCYNCGQTGAPEPDLTNLGYKKSNADGSWPGVSVGGQGPGDGQVFSSEATINQNDWCLVSPGLSTTYVFRKNDAGTGVDAATYQVGSNSWSPMSIAPPAFGAGRGFKSGAGLFGATDGTNVWLFFVNTDAANTILYSRFSGSSWTAWTPVPGTDTGTHTRNYLSGYPRAGNGQIGLIWTEGTSTFNAVSTALITSGPQAMSVTPSGARMAAAQIEVVSMPPLALADRRPRPARVSLTLAPSAWLERRSHFKPAPSRGRSRALLVAAPLSRFG